jgi:hypothetical protein
VVEGTGLENRQGETLREFESRSLRSMQITSTFVLVLLYVQRGG